MHFARVTECDWVKLNKLKRISLQMKRFLLGAYVTPDEKAEKAAKKTTRSYEKAYEKLWKCMKSVWKKLYASTHFIHGFKFFYSIFLLT